MSLKTSPFHTLFDQGVNYLNLLNLGADADVAISLVEAALLDPSAEDQAIASFKQGNWRPHLVASIAVLLKLRSENILSKLWECVLTGTWVTPQLIVTSFLVDPSFEARSVLLLSDVQWFDKHLGLAAAMIEVLAGCSGLPECVELCRLRLDEKIHLRAILGPSFPNWDDEMKERIAREEITQRRGQITRGWLIRVLELLENFSHVEFYRTPKKF